MYAVCRYRNGDQLVSTCQPISILCTRNYTRLSTHMLCYIFLHIGTHTCICIYLSTLLLCDIYNQIYIYETIPPFLDVITWYAVCGVVLPYDIRTVYYRLLPWNVYVYVCVYNVFTIGWLHVWWNGLHTPWLLTNSSTLRYDVMNCMIVWIVAYDTVVEVDVYGDVACFDDVSILSLACSLYYYLLVVASIHYVIDWCLLIVYEYQCKLELSENELMWCDVMLYDVMCVNMVCYCVEIQVMCLLYMIHSIMIMEYNQVKVWIWSDIIGFDVQ
jgi:hypothetical protein